MALSHCYVYATLSSHYYEDLLQKFWAQSFIPAQKNYEKVNTERAGLESRYIPKIGNPSQKYITFEFITKAQNYVQYTAYNYSSQRTTNVNP